MTDVNENPIFIVGAPGSGTSLMRSLLNKHSRIALATEMHFVTQWMDQFSDTDVRTETGFDAFWMAYSTHKHFQWLNLDADEARATILRSVTRPLAFESIYQSLMRQYACRAGCERYGEKTPANFRVIALLKSWFPRAQILFMIRDPRAIASSNLMTDEPWGQKNLLKVSLDWCASVKAYERWRDDQLLHAVQYERLVTDPLRQLTEIFAFLGEGLETEVFGRDEAATDGGFPSNQLDPWGPISTTSLEVWRERLEPEQVALVEHVTRRWAPRFGYRPTRPGLSSTERWRTRRDHLGIEVRRAARATLDPSRSGRIIRQRLRQVRSASR